MSAEDSVIPAPPSSILTTDNLPHIVNGWLLQILRFHFADPRNITQEKLKPYVWRSDEKETRIVINPIYAWEPRNIQQRPAIILRRQPWKVEKLALGDKYQGHLANDGMTASNHAVMIQGAHTIYCHAMTGLESEELGAEVGYHLLEFQQHILQRFRLHGFKMESIGEVKRTDEPHQHFVVPLTITYAQVHGWSIQQETPIWTGFSVRTDFGN